MVKGTGLTFVRWKDNTAALAKPEEFASRPAPAPGIHDHLIPILEEGLRHIRECREGIPCQPPFQNAAEADLITIPVGPL